MQLHLYVPAELGEQIRRRAAARGLTVSRYLAELVQRDVGGGWPEHYFEEVVGAWKGEPLKRPEQGVVERRDEL